jgi:tRNA-Thr(GGU) m(6)t(6)A37 methyltransferase TsaA
MSISKLAELKFIGEVESAGEEEATISIYKEFSDGLDGIRDFSHLIILYWIHLQDKEELRHTLRVTPRRHALNLQLGVFATRSPTRPNPVGLCVVELLKLDGRTLIVKGLDAITGSPIVDIKPYLPRSDCIANATVPEWTLHGPPT